MVIVLMGAAGAGKSTLGQRLSHDLRWPFLDGDSVHAPANIAKMASGTPLTEEDRRSWLEALKESLGRWIEHDVHGVLAASLLTAEHRAAVLSEYQAQVKLVYLRVPRLLLRERLTGRSGHFAGVQLLDSQLALLQEPTDALVLDGSQSVERLAQTIRRSLHV